MPEFHGTAKDGMLWLPNALVAQRKRWLHTSESSPVVEKVWILRQSKSWAQVKTVFGLAIATIKYELDDRGIDTATFLGLDVPNAIPVPRSLIKEVLYVACPIYDDDDKRITLSSANAHTANIAQFITDIQSFAATRWGIYIPDPNPNWKDKE